MGMLNVHMKTFTFLWSVHKVEIRERFKSHTTELKTNVQFFNYLEKIDV